MTAPAGGSLPDLGDQQSARFRIRKNPGSRQLFPRILKASAAPMLLQSVSFTFRDAKQLLARVERTLCTGRTCDVAQSCCPIETTILMPILFTPIDPHPSFGLLLG